MSKLLFAFGPFHLNLKEKATGEHIYVLERTDRRPQGVWPHLTIFPRSTIHGGLDIHMTWGQSRVQRREFLCQMQHGDIEAFLKPFGDRWLKAMCADIRRVSPSELARQGYVALYAADQEKTLEFFKSVVPMGPKNRRTVDLSRFEKAEELFEGMEFADPRELAHLLTTGVIKEPGPISCIKPDGTGSDALMLHPIRTQKGWSWEARPAHTVGGLPLPEVLMRMLLGVLPESFLPSLLRVVDEMGMREFGVDTSDFERDWARARAFSA